MRLFVAVRPPPRIAATAASVVAEAVNASGASELRLTAVEQLHLTLAFYGEVRERAVPELAARLRRVAARSAPMTVALRGAGAFPRARAAQVLWLGVEEYGDGDGLRRVAARSAAAGRRAGVDVEQRGWRGHVTVARARRPTDVVPIVTLLDQWAGEPWQAREMELVRSHLGAQVRHEVLERYPLGARSGSGHHQA